MSDKKEKSGSKAKKIIIIILIILLSLIFIGVSAFFIMNAIGRRQFHAEDTGITVSNPDIPDIEIKEDEIEYKGKEYELDEDVVSILFLGVDKKSVNSDLGYGKNGQADSIFVAALNTRDKSIKMLPLSRETMVDVNLYSANGEYTGVKNEQLCLAYAYGDTPENCSKNVMASVRRILYGVNISSYVTIDLAGVEKMTDAIGGVSLPCLEEFTLDGRTYKVGEQLNLNGYLARHYIQNRSKTDIEGNSRRMLRQKQFLSAFANKAGNQIMDNFTKLATYYNTMSPYYSTNLSLPQVTYLASSCLTMNVGNGMDYKIIKGKLTTDGELVQFYPDETSALENVIDIFYKEKE